MRHDHLHLLILLVLGAIAVSIKLFFFPLSENHDYYRYIETAKLFIGVEVQQVFPEYILKPFAPLVISLFANILDGYRIGFVSQVLVFYFALIVVFYYFARSFFRDDFSAFLATCFFMLGYPMLRYGIDLFIETGSLFFFVTGLYLAFNFIKHPTKKLLIFNLVVSVLGFLWKEYSIVHFIIFSLLLILHPYLDRQTKFRFSFLYLSVFLMINIVWQLFVYLMFHYTYFQWYRAGIAGFGREYNLFNLTKSLFALLIAAWPLALVGYARFKMFSAEQKLFLFFSVPVPLIALLWGWVSSRLFYVIAAPQVLLAAHGLSSISRKRWASLVFLVLVLSSNFIWLFLSYRIQFDSR